MSYPLLEAAPKDHLTDEFREYIITNNNVVHDLQWWLVIENCKYHHKDGNRGWWTAFIKRDCPHHNWITGNEWNELFEYMPLSWEVLIKSPQDRSVELAHVHFIEK